MPFRFRRSIRLAPGVRINLSKRGTSVSIGGRGAHVTLSDQGTRTTIGLPGTGLSYSELRRPDAVPPTESTPTSAKPGAVTGATILILVLLIALVLALAYLPR